MMSVEVRALFVCLFFPEISTTYLYSSWQRCISVPLAIVSTSVVLTAGLFKADSWNPIAMMTMPMIVPEHMA